MELILRIDDLVPSLAPSERDLPEGFISLHIFGEADAARGVVTPVIADLRQHVELALGSYWAASWWGPQELCARAVFTRRLQAFVNSLSAGDKQNAQAISKLCTQLRTLLKGAPFSSSNWVWRSRFEEALFMCLAAFETALHELQSTQPRHLHAGTGKRNKFQKDANNLLECMRHRGFADRSCVLPVYLLSSQSTLNFLLPTCLLSSLSERLLMLDQLGFYMSAFVIGAEGLALITNELYLLSQGMIDKKTLLRDIFEAMLVSGIAWSDPFSLGPRISYMLGCLSPAMLASSCVRALDRFMVGEDRDLHCAYETLLLSPAGVGVYSPDFLERHLDFLLSERPDHAGQFLAAYLRIKEMQFEELNDPYVQQRPLGPQTCDSSFVSDASALRALGFEQNENPGQQAIRQRWHHLCRLSHPDKGGNAEDFRLIMASYKHLEAKQF